MKVTYRELTTAEREVASVESLKHRGMLVGTRRVGDTVRYDGRIWSVYDADAEGDGSLLVLWNGPQMARYVSPDAVTIIKIVT